MTAQPGEQFRNSPRQAGERTSASWPMSIDRHPATMVGNQQKEEEEEEGRQ